MKTQLQLRVDENIKKSAMDIYQDLGLTLSDAVNVFLKKSISVGGFPFDVRKSQFELSMDEASKEYEAFLSAPDKYKQYESAHEMFEDISSEK